MSEDELKTRDKRVGFSGSGVGFELSVELPLERRTYAG